MLESTFDKVAVLRNYKLINADYETGASLAVKFTNFLRTFILKNICERLLLNLRESNAGVFL